MGWLDDKLLSKFNIELNKQGCITTLSNGEQIQSQYLIGADGSHSFVRKHFEIPFSIIRTISDVADDKSHIDFPSFIKKISSKYAAEIIKNIFKAI